ncbi:MULTISPECIES: hypothetical protein [Clostridium]|uniref:hypothetical protein n=1 Tax=Clostridium TaxID=1485 RepID=UPI000C08BA07|nr:hypothetical protein [Clostridium cadaveris]MDU4953466.1 hypothetical protein [Clostridium sp.]UFH63874.1 hypothetical protein KQH81_10975 [Clostridium cadaveris]
MARIQTVINKVSKALKAKGLMPLINHEQFYGDEGQPITKYIIHYGRPRGKENDVYDIVFNKVDLLKDLIEILKAGDNNG